LLRAEFPDITISKIRFLESQGLVSPQRSPSGYRKFYDEDIERLRYVLVQQREHFLPLKVIRDRLNGEESPEEGGEAPASSERAVAVADLEIETKVASNGSTSHSAAVVEPKALRAAREPVAASKEPARATRVAAKEPSMSDVVSALQEGPSVAKPAHAPSAARPAPAADPVVDEPSAPDDAETLTAEELALKLGVEESYIDSLVEFGVITPVTIAGLTCFDEGSASVARIAVKFSAYGVEPRHLRQFRISVEREVGLIDQIVSPLLRQRNPEARAKAAKNAKELAKLSRDMRATLVTEDLRKLFSW
jgi:DNA-binding transcriptional MerR regulator